MPVEISDKGKALLALCNEKEKLQNLADAYNEEVKNTVIVFETKMRELSNYQRDILAKMIAVDDAIRDIAQTC